MHLFKIHLNYWVGWVRGIIFIISLWKASEPDRNFAYEFQVYRSETHLHFHIFSSLRIEFYLIPKFAFLSNIKVKSTWIGNHALWSFRRSFHNIFWMTPYSSPVPLLPQSPALTNFYRRGQKCIVFQIHLYTR